jgi:hypothetical protein
MGEKRTILIPDSVLEQIHDLLKQASALLRPYETPLTPAERRDLPKMGEKTLGFVEKAHEFATQSPDLAPPFLDMANFDASLADAHNLWPLFLLTQQLHEGVDDIATLAGSEAYRESLIFYNSVKMAARQDVLGAKAVCEDLKKSFPRRKHKRRGEDEPEADS